MINITNRLKFVMAIILLVHCTIRLHYNNRITMEHTMKLRAILKSMFKNYCSTFKDVPPASMF